MQAQDLNNIYITFRLQYFFYNRFPVWLILTLTIQDTFGYPCRKYNLCDAACQMGDILELIFDSLEYICSRQRTLLENKQNSHL